MRHYKNNLQVNQKEFFSIYELVLSYIGSRCGHGVINYNYGFVYWQDYMVYDNISR